MGRKIDYDALSREIIDEIVYSGRIDEVEIDGLWFVFKHPEIRERSERVYTGVEMLGEKESYLRTIYEVEPLQLQGVYDDCGDRVKCDFNPSLLKLDYQDQVTQIIYN